MNYPYQIKYSKFFKSYGSKGGRHGGAVVSTAAPQQRGPEFNSLSLQGPPVWGVHVLPVPVWVLSVFSGFLPQSKDVQHNRLIDYSELAVGVRVSGFLSPCVCDELVTCPGCTLPLTQCQLG